MREEMDAYLQSWNTLLTPLIEPIISSVSGQPIDPIRDTLSKSERGAIKDKFRRKLWKRECRVKPCSLSSLTS